MAGRSTGSTGKVLSDDLHGRSVDRRERHQVFYIVVSFIENRLLQILLGGFDWHLWLWHYFDFDFESWPPTADHIANFSILTTIPQVSTVVWYNYRAHLSFRTNFSVSYTSIRCKHRFGNNVWTDLFLYVARSGHPPCGRNNGPLRFF